MKLMYQTHSPYARKTLVFAHEVGLAQQLEVVHHETSPTARNPEVFAANPLGTVPVLIHPALEPLFHSDAICACLETLHGGRALIPADGEERWYALRLQALAQGCGRHFDSIGNGAPAKGIAIPGPLRWIYGNAVGELRLVGADSRRQFPATRRPYRSRHHFELD